MIVCVCLHGACINIDEDIHINKVHIIMGQLAHGISVCRTFPLIAAGYDLCTLRYEIQASLDSTIICNMKINVGIDQIQWYLATMAYKVK